jgi:hypothetical protein
MWVITTSFTVAACDAEEGQALARGSQERALALPRHVLAEARVDDDGPLGVADQPDEVIHRHRPIVRIAADEVGAARASRVAYLTA